MTTNSITLAHSPTVTQTPTTPKMSPTPGLAKPIAPATTKGITTIPKGSTVSKVATPTKGHSFMSKEGPIQFLAEKGWAGKKGQRRAKILEAKDGTRKSVKTGKRKASGVDIVGEILREKPEHYRHVLQKLDPIPVYGLTLEELKPWYTKMTRASALLDEEMTMNGKVVVRGQRDSTVTMVCAVASYPGDMPKVGDPDFMDWLKRVTGWAKEHYGEINLKSIVLHMDETHAHVHIVVADGVQLGGSVRHLMSGFKASIPAKKKGVKGKALTDVYNADFVKFQDGFFESVSRPSGHARKSLHHTPHVDYSTHKRQKAVVAAALEEANIEAEEIKEHARKLRRLAQELNDDLTRKTARADFTRLSDHVKNLEMEVDEVLDEKKQMAFNTVFMLKAMIQKGFMTKRQAVEEMKDAGIDPYSVDYKW